MSPPRLSLQSLPNEIRGMIWDFFLPTTEDIETDVCSFGNCPHQPGSPEHCHTHAYGDGEPEGYSWKPTPLLLVDRQTHAEVERMIQARKLIRKQNQVLGFCGMQCFANHIRNGMRMMVRPRGSLAFEAMRPANEFKVPVVIRLPDPSQSRMMQMVRKHEQLHAIIKKWEKAVGCSLDVRRTQTNNVLDHGLHIEVVVAFRFSNCGPISILADCKFAPQTPIQDRQHSLRILQRDFALWSEAFRTSVDT